MKSLDLATYRALMAVFARYQPNIVRIDIGHECYYVICEYKGKPGQYYTVEYPFSGLNGIATEIKDAILELKWQADGGEFPDRNFN